MSLPPDFSPEYLAEDRRTPAMIGIVVVTVLSFIVVVIRLYARRCLIRELGWDDYVIVLAQLVSWATMACCMMILHYGSGRHLAYLLQTPSTLVHMYKWLFTTQMVYMFNLWLCRVSGLAFYARLNPMPQFLLYLRLSFAFVTAVYVAQTLIIALQCIPLRALWSPETAEGGGKCMGSEVVFVSTGALTIACDSLILLLPVKIVMGLQARWARKIALLGVLCFGVFAVVASVLRMVAMIISVNNPTDATWYFSPVIAWTCAEISAAIIALSLPALRTIFGFLKEQRSTRDQSGSGSGGIGLSSVSNSKSRSAKGKVFQGTDSYINTVEVEGSTVRSPRESQEALWGTGNGGEGEGGRGRNGTGELRKIRVTETVDVDVRQY
ncbi:hypothetical protein BJY04DRAFT_215287 [Aspergillus karnatakaensis]|uniref:uncharacterized protein n=1 Tax=Aspergillus karnatakaensis TaxID=1810916 RepID=UPI003CCD64E6